MFRTFFREFTTQSNTACGGRTGHGRGVSPQVRSRVELRGSQGEARALREGRRWGAGRNGYARDQKKEQDSYRLRTSALPRSRLPEVFKNH